MKSIRKGCQGDEWWNTAVEITDSAIANAAHDLDELSLRSGFGKIERKGTGMKKEDQNIEYKQSWREEYLKGVCGFANVDGGRLLKGGA